MKHSLSATSEPGGAPTDSPLAHLERRLADLRDAGLHRTRPAPVSDVARSFCSNDYLGLAGTRHDQLKDPGAIAPSAGAGASRLIVGERPEHAALETALASWLGARRSLLFSSGYAANVGVISALAEAGDLVVSDELNHASIIDGCRLSRARVVVTPHLDTGAIERALASRRTGRAWVVTESYFSMDADSPDLPLLRRVCDRHGAALIVDEAHAVGLFGPSGRGLCAQAGVRPEVLVGTLGKSFGAAGAFVAGSEDLVDWLWNRARSFVFSTGMSPVVSVAAREALRVVTEDPARRERVHRNAAHLRAGLARLGLRAKGHGPVIPVVVGDPRAALAIAASLRTEGVHVQAVRPPTVPVETARLRITTTAAHSVTDIEGALAAIERTQPWPAPSR